ncbi:hypothetical protein FHL15_010476 [Xylaria flabelliformis]|uniref:Uncharacterized protein n=1 Tax=Xylaria flabelliformis TaxID=2512241 RepID=A0A553HKZ7_9PEZI|nr:hypothetical protein FHL15_010476 [Xylaria flabelliformis]
MGAPARFLDADYAAQQPASRSRSTSASFLQEVPRPGEDAAVILLCPWRSLAHISVTFGQEEGDITPRVQAYENARVSSRQDPKMSKRLAISGYRRDGKPRQFFPAYTGQFTTTETPIDLDRLQTRITYYKGSATSPPWADLGLRQTNRPNAARAPRDLSLDKPGMAATNLWRTEQEDAIPWRRLCLAAASPDGR